MTWLRISFVVLLACSPAFADNWPQWRGPKGDGHSAEKGLPLEWGPDKNIAWKFRMPGIGAGTPVVWEDKIFLTSVDGDDISVLCIGTDGTERWRRKLSDTGSKRYKNPAGADVSDASASCCTDGKHVWAYSGSGALACFTVAGEPVWTTDISKFGKISIAFGAHWTPVLHGGKLYLQVMHRTAQKIVCYDAATGNVDWAVDRPGAGKGESPDVYASAFMWEGKGGPLLIAHGNDYCTGHRLTDGSEVWRVQGLNPRNSGAWRFVSSPLATPDLIIVPSCKNGPTVGLDPTAAKGDIEEGNAAELWRINITPDVVSPIRVDDVVYFCSPGTFMAFEAKSGKEIYKGDITKGFHWSNLIAADGKIYAMAQDGVTDVIEAGRHSRKWRRTAFPIKCSAPQRLRMASFTSVDTNICGRLARWPRSEKRLRSLHQPQ